MAFDFKKEYKEFYMPKNKPEIVTVPKANYIAVTMVFKRRTGNRNAVMRKREVIELRYNYRLCGMVCYLYGSSIRNSR